MLLIDIENELEFSFPQDLSTGYYGLRVEGTDVLEKEYSTIVGPRAVCGCPDNSIYFTTRDKNGICGILKVKLEEKMGDGVRVLLNETEHKKFPEISGLSLIRWRGEGIFSFEKSGGGVERFYRWEE